MNRLKSFFTRACLIFCFFIITGCAQYIVPTPQIVNPDKTAVFKINSNIRLLNLQKDNTEKIEFSSGMRAYEGNLAEWTDAAIRQLSEELSKRGGQITDEGTKIIKLSIIKYNIEAWTRACYQLTVHVETGSGYTKDYYAENCIAPFGDSVARGFGGAITLAITDMFNDKNFVHYLRSEHE